MPPRRNTRSACAPVNSPPATARSHLYFGVIARPREGGVFVRLGVRVVVLLLPSHRETCRDVSLGGKRTGGPSSPKSSSSRSGKSSASARSKSSSASTTARTSGAAAIIACASSAPRPRAFGTSAPSLGSSGFANAAGLTRARRASVACFAATTADRRKTPRRHTKPSRRSASRTVRADVAATSWTSIERAVTKPTPPRTGKDFDAAPFFGGGSRRGGGDDDPDATAGARLPPPPRVTGGAPGGVLMGRSSGRDPHRGAFASRVPRSRPGGRSGTLGGSAERAMRAIANGARGGTRRATRGRSPGEDGDRVARSSFSASRASSRWLCRRRRTRRRR